ncbi:MAG: acetyltransferase [Bacteroidales bacterium]|nr:acetyltransferase [Bacteroidales bacterium]
MDFDKYVFFLAIGNPKTRESVYNKYPKTIEYATIIHPSAVISNYVKLGDGCFVGAGSIIDADVIIGKQSHLNFHSVIGHDCRIGDFFSAAQAVNIGGNCHFGNTVWFGTNSCVKQGVKICDDVVVGIGDCIVKDITEQGIYVGRPARKIR